MISTTPAPDQFPRFSPPKPLGMVVFAFALPLPRQDEAESDLVGVGAVEMALM